MEASTNTSGRNGLIGLYGALGATEMSNWTFANNVGLTGLSGTRNITGLGALNRAAGQIGGSPMLAVEEQLRRSGQPPLKDVDKTVVVVTCPLLPITA